VFDGSQHAKQRQLYCLAPSPTHAYAVDRSSGSVRDLSGSAFFIRKRLTFTSRSTATYCFIKKLTAKNHGKLPEILSSLNFTSRNAPYLLRLTTVGLDGGYVRHCDPAAGHSFEIIAGRLLADDGAQSSVGFVRTVDQHSRTRVQRAVAEQGKTSDHHLMVFTDGDSRLRDLQLSVLPKATHVLDWYHLTRRLTVLSNVVCSKEAAAQLPSREHARLSEWVGSIKWRLWHGRPVTAIARLESLLSLLARPSLAGKAVVLEPTSLPPSCFNT
jgi:hypothetical protein